MGSPGTGVFPPVGWLTNRQTAERLGVGIDTLVTNWKYRETLKAAARTVGKPGGGRCNLYPVELVERIVAEREAASRAVVPDGFVDGDRAAEMLGVARQTWNGWLSNGTIQIESPQCRARSNNGRRKLYAVGDVERLRRGTAGGGQTVHRPRRAGAGQMADDRRGGGGRGRGGPKTWDIWSKSGGVPAGVWVRGPMGQPTQMWPEKVALDAQSAGDGRRDVGDDRRVAGDPADDEADAGRSGSARRRVPAGVPGRSNGSAATLWRAAELRALRAEWDARPFPPAGYVDREGRKRSVGHRGGDALPLGARGAVRVRGRADGPGGRVVVPGV